MVSADGRGLRRVAAGGKQPSWAPGGRRLVYGGDLDMFNEAFGVYVVGADGRGARRLARGSAPVWAPRGERIAYQCASLRFAVCLVDADGSRRRAIAGNAALERPVWAPDGTRLAFAYLGDGFALVRADGSGLRRLTGDGEPAAWSPDGRRIVFVRALRSGLQLFVTGAERPSRPRRVTSEPIGTDFSNVRWERDGRISYAAYLGFNDHEIAVMRADGRGPRILTRNLVEDREPAFSPDGRTIAFSRGDAGRAVIRLIDADGGRDRPLTKAGPRRDTNPAWSPDGRRIAFVRAPQRGANDEALVCGALALMNADGSGLRSIGTPPVVPGRISWSPDGRRLVFSACTRSGNATDLFVVGADGRGLRRLVTGSNSWAPTWSPDGTRILFGGSPTRPPFEDRQDLFTIRPDGTGLVRLVENVAFNQGGSWSPNGARFAFTRGRGPFFQIVLANADGREKTQITHGVSSNLDPTWRPGSLR